eukprot:TRINITY_DN10993_c0_g1_i2.p5 TRINITY_DN10993_c0_g1~~TRINITY_DN10993_c0_g1_i2.p5  ORF type:complete len:125 (-),score=9.18 TRINITY_DN10993_c0_g1_i2:4347-4721(-)
MLLVLLLLERSVQRVVERAEVERVLHILALLTIVVNQVRQAMEGRLRLLVAGNELVETLLVKTDLLVQHGVAGLDAKNVPSRGGLRVTDDEGTGGAVGELVGGIGTRQFGCVPLIYKGVQEVRQ